MEFRYYNKISLKSAIFAFLLLLPTCVIAEESQQQKIRYLWFLPPQNADWLTSTPKIRDAAKSTGIAFHVDEDKCGWYYIAFMDEDLPNEVIIYNDHGKELGVNGLWETAVATPIPLKKLYEEKLTDELFFIADEEEGWYGFYPNVDGACRFNLAALIYDTDVSLNSLFSEYEGETSELAENCLGVRTGIVKSILGKDGKPELNVGSANAKACFDDDPELFNTLFNYKTGINEAVCHDLSLAQKENSRWEYNSDYQVNGRYTGGFFPVENTADEDVIYEPLHAARSKHSAEAPAKVESLPKGISKFEYVCNGPGWNGGIDCENLFLSNEPEGVTWDWFYSPSGKERWRNVERNHHFCFESHASFTYQGDEVLSVMGSGDTWVFIGGKLAVDLGGAHLSAPGYVDFKKIKDAAGLNLLVGKTYNLDAFYCSRRTTQSNFAISTNAYLQNGGDFVVSRNAEDPSGYVSYNICWVAGHSCANISMGGLNESIKACGSEIERYLPNGIRYVLVDMDRSIFVELNDKKVFYGGIDLTNRGAPKINVSKITGLPSGSYKLWVFVADAKKSISFRIRGSIDVVNQTVVYTPVAGDEVSGYYPKGSTWKFVDKVLAGTRFPVYVSAVSDYDIDLLSAVGQSYTLTALGADIYTSKNGFERAAFPRVIDDSGVDTLWVDFPEVNMTGNTQKISLKVRSLVAEVTVYASSKDYENPLEIAADKMSVDAFGKIYSYDKEIVIEADAVKSYAVLDIQGRVISRGLTNNSSTIVHIPAAGTYFVKVGAHIHSISIE